MAVLKRGAFAGTLLLVPVVAHAQQAANALATDKILTTLQAATATWNGPAATIGLELLAGLAVIAFALSVGYSFLQEGGLNPLAMGAILIRQVVYFGFWMWMLQNWASSFGSAIIRSFQQAAFSMGGVKSDPMSIVSQGFNICGQLWSQMSALHPGAAVGLAISGILIFICFLVVAFLIMLALSKAFITIAIGAIAMGFAGYPETRHLAYNGVFMTIAAGGRLFMIQLLAGMGNTILQGLAGNGPLGQDSVWPILAVVFIWACLSFSLPALAEHMFGGTGHARAGAGQLVAATSSAVTTSAGLATGQSMSAAVAIGSAGRNMFVALTGSSGGSGRLLSGSGVGVSAAAPGTRMRSTGARYTTKGP
jgi:type IV secretion system protein TrbL